MKQIPTPNATIRLVAHNNAVGLIATVYLDATPAEWKELTGLMNHGPWVGQEFQQAIGINTYRYEWIGPTPAEGEW